MTEVQIDDTVRPATPAEEQEIAEIQSNENRTIPPAE
tara:strand:- start:1446 stop:1556 length:111 start_codon:yes stop_codon:yes gene_type:complete